LITRGLGSALVQLLSQFGAVVGFVAEHAFRGLGSADQALGYRAIVRFTARSTPRTSVGR
jgi:hypothetical protein